MKSARGNVLTLVLYVLLVLSILVTAMLRLPGALRRNVSLVAKETQEMYLAESAVIAKLEGFPEHFFADLPAINASYVGPWTEWRTDEFQFLLGNSFGRFSTSEWAACASFLEGDLRKRILQTDGLKSLSGNRRFFALDSGVSSVALNIIAGDLTLDLGGSGVRPKVKSFKAFVEGDVKVLGNVHYDSLRIYSMGAVSLQGHVDADFVEIFGFAGVSVAGDVSLSGILLSKQNVEVMDRANLRFPSVAIAVGYRGNRLALQGKSVIDALAVAPSGIVERDSSVLLLDSSKTLLPHCMDSRMVVFERRRL